MRYLIISIGFVLIYSIFRWYFDYNLGIIHFKKNFLNFWIPFILPLLLIAMCLRREVRILNIKGKNGNGYFGYLLVAAITISVPTLITQEYIEASSSQLLDVNSVYEIKQAKSIDCYTIKDFKVIKEYAGAHRTSRISGKYNQDLNFAIYFVVPIVDDTKQIDVKNHRYWYGFKFTERMSNHASDEKKNERWRAFYEDSMRKYKQYDFTNFQYLQGVSFSDDRDGYLEAIKNKQKNGHRENLVILEPINEPFAEKAGNKLAWILGSFGIGSVVFLLMVLIPSINQTELKRYIDKKPLEEDDSKNIINFLIPKGEHFTTSLLIHINLLVFLYLVFSGVNIMSATPKELLELGGSRRNEILNGEYWRLLTSMFLHGGMMHLFMNIFGIGITCSLIEPILGRWKTLMAYLISGVGASLMSIYWHDNALSVGASGAIFGMMGVMIALLISKKDKGFRGAYLIILGLYGGMSLLFGLLGGIDNAAHMGGLLTGFAIGLLIILTDWGKTNPR